MKVSTRSRYGLRLLVDLCRRDPGKPVFLGDIAKSQAISEKYLSKLVIPLRGAGILKSERGSRGGYVLARKPESISLREIVETLEGGISLIDCTDDIASCSRSADCSARSVWAGLEKAVRDYCEAVSLADIAGRENSAPYAFSI
jgi:Rrf2 family protein